MYPHIIYIRRSNKTEKKQSINITSTRPCIWV